MKTLLSFIALILFFNSVNAGDYYWVNGTGNWSDYAIHWSNTSGGSVFHVQTPTPLDNVYFDANSFTTTGDTVYVDSTIINCLNLDLSGAVNYPLFKNINGGAHIDIYGSFIVHSNVNWNITGFITFKSASPGNIINTSGAVLTGSSPQYPNFYFDGSGSWILQSDLVLDSNYFYNGGYINIKNGSLISNNYSIKCRNFDIVDPGNALLGTSQIYCDSWHLDNMVHPDVDSATINCTGYFDSGINNIYYDVNGGSAINSNNCSFHDVSGADFSLMNLSTFHNVLVYGNASSFNSNSSVFNKVVFVTSFVNLSGSSSFDTLIFNNPGMTINLADIQSVNSFLQADGTCGGLTVLKGSAVTPAVISMAGGSVILNYVLLQNITGSGGASFTANSSFDGGSVSGITINASSPADLYWVGGTGNWNDVTHWALSSGGTGGSCVPSPADNVFFDANSFPSTGDTVYLNNLNTYCKNLDLGGAVNYPVFKNISGSFHLDIYGSFIVHSNVNWNITGFITFKSASPGNIINTSGAVLTGSSPQYPNFYFDGSGSWILQSDLVLDSNYFYNGGYINIKNGSLISNNYSIKCRNFDIVDPGNALLGTSQIYCDSWHLDNMVHPDVDSATINCTGYFDSGINNIYYDVNGGSAINSNNCSFHDVSGADFSLMNLSTFHNVLVYGNASSFNSNSSVFNKVVFVTSFVNLSGSSSFDTLIFNNPGMTINLADIQSVNSFLQADGTCGGLTVLKGSAVTPAVISMAGGSVILNYVLLQNITGSGGASFTANSSFDGGSVSGITINASSPADLYWVGGTGNWNDVTHWALSSGGTGGSCVPSPADNVFFDANSFPSTGDTVYLNNLNTYCKNLDLGGAVNYPVFKNISGSFHLDIYGSFIVHSNVNWNITGFITFKSASPGNIINTSGAVLTGSSPQYPNFYFDGSGSWILQSDLVLDSNYFYNGGYINIKNGSLISNNYSIKCRNFDIVDPGNALLGTSQIYCDSWHLDNMVHPDVDSATINCTGYFDSGINNIYYDVNGGSAINSNNCSFHDVSGADFSLMNLSTFHNVLVYGNASSFNSNSSVFNKVVFVTSFVNLSGSSSFDTLIFNNPGMTINLADIQSVNSFIYIQSDPGFPVSFHGPGTINYGDTICSDFIYLQDITATGGGQFYAGIHSVDLGGNNGWQFTSCAPVISNVWPGDANYDLVVDNFDLLYIGVAYNDTGYVRPGGSNTFIAQPCQDWFYQFINGTNVKKADSDGNGIVDAADTTAVSLNYGLTHPFRVAHYDATYTSGTDLILQMPGGQAVPGSTVSVPILLGTPINNADNIYGIAFTINYDLGMIQQGTVNIDFSNSWIENGSNHLNIVKDFPLAGKCDAAFTRIDGIDITGNGLIGHLNFTIANNAVGYLHFSISKIKLISHNEIEIPVAAHADSVFTNIGEISRNSFVVYPNPSYGKTNVHLNNIHHEKYQLLIYNTEGQIVYRNNTNQEDIVIDRTNINPGIYFLEIRNESCVPFKEKIVFY